MIYSLRMIFRECKCKNVGIAGYAEAFSFVLSGNQTSEDVNYLFPSVLVQRFVVVPTAHINEYAPSINWFLSTL